MTSKDYCNGISIREWIRFSLEFFCKARNNPGSWEPESCSLLQWV